MLELKRNENEDAVRAYCAASSLACGDCEAYTATDGTAEVGYCVFTRSNGTLLLLAANAQADYGAALVDGLVRAAMAYAAHGGITTARFDPGFDAVLRDKLRAFGHIDETVPDIDKFLTICKNCCRQLKN